jgi:hypothetical protein
MRRRQLGKSGIKVSPLGLGGMPFGGAMMSGEGDGGYRFFLGDVDDGETTRTIHKAIDLGVFLFDTAPAYGAGHSEEILGRSLAGRRDQVVVVDSGFESGGYARGGVDDLALSDGIVFAAALEGLLVVDVRDPNVPRVLITIEQLPDASRIEIVEDRLYVLTPWLKFWVLDVSRPSAPEVLGVVGGLSFPSSFDVSGDNLFLAADQGTLQIIDISEIDG